MNTTTKIIRCGSNIKTTNKQKKDVNDLVKTFPNIIMEMDTYGDVKSRRLAMQLRCSRRTGVKGMQALKNMEIDSIMKVCRLVNNFGQCSSQMDVIKRRLGSNNLEALTMTLKLQVLPQDKMLRVWMQNMIVKQIAQKLLKWLYIHHQIE